jgi:protein TonB
MFSLIMITLVLILVGRWRTLHASKGLTSKYRNKVWKSPLEARVKYPDVEIFQYSRFGLLFGIVCALLVSFTLLNWTVSDHAEYENQDISFSDVDIEITPPQTSEPPPPPPPPPPPSVIEVPEEMVSELEETLEFMDQSIEAEAVIDVPPPPVEAKPAPVITPPPLPPAKDDAEEIFKVVEEMPRFPGCEDKGSSVTEKKACADAALYKFIHENLKYPATAVENNIEGTVVVQFVVNRDGSIQDIKILRDIGGGCGAEVSRVVRMMNEETLRWIPGKQRGRPVRVIFILPVKFKLATS